MDHRQRSSQLHVKVGGILTGNLHRAFTLRTVARQHPIVVELVVMKEVTVVGIVVAAVVVGDGERLCLIEVSLIGGSFARRGDDRVH